METGFDGAVLKHTMQGIASKLPDADLRRRCGEFVDVLAARLNAYVAAGADDVDDAELQHLQDEYETLLARVENLRQRIPEHDATKLAEHLAAVTASLDNAPPHHDDALPVVAPAPSLPQLHELPLLLRRMDGATGQLHQMLALLQRRNVPPPATPRASESDAMWIDTNT